MSENGKKHPHFEVNELDEKKKKSMASRIIVGVILAATGIPAVFFGGYAFFIFMSFFLGFAIYEFIHVTQKRYKWYVWVFTYIITISFVYWAFVKSNIIAYNANPETYRFTLESHFDEPSISWYALATSLGVYFVFGLCDKDFDIRDIVFLFTMSFLVGLGFQCMLFLRYHPAAMQPEKVGDHFFDWVSSAFLFFFVVIAAFGNDIMAYFVGVFFGKHKMSPRVSPNKSWEGFFGGWLLGGALTFGFACMVEALGHPILPAIHIFGTDSKWWAAVILSFGLPLIAVLGDLTLSLIKRYFGTKDYGKLLAAHGGVLDRADSLMFCSIFTSILIVVFEKGANFFIA
ncbi:MAG: phosphatidate cytidylyltransferase [Bacilli bacterium]|nr:phosphatidate cytidylyltransferase [Bacilli bacterium]